MNKNLNHNIQFDKCSQAGKAAAAVERLTDPTKYTGSHKERFDETGKWPSVANARSLHACFIPLERNTNSQIILIFLSLFCGGRNVGKGKGIAGRRNVVDNSGYVTGYQHKNTYDKTH